MAHSHMLRGDATLISPINVSLRCCDVLNGVRDTRSSRIAQKVMTNWSACADECRVRTHCHHFSYAGRERDGFCVFCSACELAPPYHGDRDGSMFQSWSLARAPFEQVSATAHLLRLLAPLDLNGSYSERLYGRTNAMPPLGHLRILWLELLSNESVRSLVYHAEPCRLYGLAPYRPLYSVRDIAFATPLDSLWLHSAPNSASAIPNHTWVEVTHCPDLRRFGAPAARWKYLPMWLYVAGGSGAAVNVGRTIIVPDYDEASAVLELLFAGDLYDDNCLHLAAAAPPAAKLNSSQPAFRWQAGYSSKRMNATRYALYRKSAREVARYARAQAVVDMHMLDPFDSLQIATTREWFSPLEWRHEIIMLRLRDCLPLGAPAARDGTRLRCGRPPDDLVECAEPSEALRRLSTCTGDHGALSPRAREILIQQHQHTQEVGGTCGDAAAGCWSALEQPDRHHCTAALARRYSTALRV